MTSRTEPFPSAYAAARRFGRWHRRLAFTFALTLSAIIVFGAAFAVGYARMNDGRVLPGVEVAGVDLAGLSAARPPQPSCATRCPACPQRAL